MACAGLGDPVGLPDPPRAGVAVLHHSYSLTWWRHFTNLVIIVNALLFPLSLFH
jgi:hypothetical protein